MSEEVLASGQTIGGFRLEERLGEGASGLVFRAHSQDHGEVALKLLRPVHAGGPIRARFLREARLAQRIDSRHVVPILELGEADGWPYLAMPFYPGGSLAQRLRSLGRLPVDETLALAAQLARGLDSLHEHGIVHRDVKPSNVLLDSSGTAALSDFGLSLASDSTRLTQAGQLLGTPHYLAPELIEGLEATAASDIYGLGCVLYECLAGEPPFAGRTPAELGFAHLAEPAPDVRKRRPELSDEMARALVNALAKEPRLRPTSATALARMLRLGHTASPC